MSISIRPFERQLNLLGVLLKARDGLTWADISRVEGYNDTLPDRSRQKRFERDLHDLKAAGLVVSRALEDGARVRYTLNRAACLMPALNLSAEQRLLLFRLGMAYLQDRDPGPLAAHLSSALLKLQAGAGREGLPAVVPPSFVRRSLNRRPAESGLLHDFGLALLERRRVRFGYEDARGESQVRTVAPYGLVSRRGGWYLVGQDEDRKSVRTFRLSRVRGDVSEVAPRAPVPQYDVPASFDPERSFSTEPFGSGEHSFRDVQIRFDAEVAFIVHNDFGGHYRIADATDGSATLHLPQAYPGELLRYLAEFSGHWQVLQPAELRTFVVKRLNGALKALGVRP